MSRLAFLLAVSCVVVSAAEAEFSHKLHVGGVGVACAACHASVAESDAAEDRNLPSSKVCLACHNGGEAPEIDVSALDEREPAERSFRFNHQFHLSMGDVAPAIAAAIDSGDYLGIVPDIRAELDRGGQCVGCHRGLSEADVVDSKIHLPGMADCLVCHNEIDNPFTCEKCHPADFQIKPADHTREFIDQHSTGKAGFNKLTCQPCHGRNFTCMGCH